MMWSLQSYPTTVLNERMWHFRRSKHALTPPTYFQGVRTPNPHDLRTCANVCYPANMVGIKLHIITLDDIRGVDRGGCGLDSWPRPLNMWEGSEYVMAPPHKMSHFYTALSLAAQCIVVGPVCLPVFVCGFVCLFVDLTKTRNCVHRSSPNWVCRWRFYLQLIKFWPSCVPGKGSAAGQNFFASPCYSQRAVFASLWALFSFHSKLLLDSCASFI